VDKTCGGGVRGRLSAGWGGEERAEKMRRGMIGHQRAVNSSESRAISERVTSGKAEANAREIGLLTRKSRYKAEIGKNGILSRWFRG